MPGDYVLTDAPDALGGGGMIQVWF
jgi:hypothetical protein